MIDHNNHKIINNPKGNSPHGKCSAKNRKVDLRTIKIDEKEVFDHLDTLVRQSVEETINSLLDAEADAICNANRYQRSPAMILVGARLRHISTTKWGTRQYLCTCKIYEQGVP
jgi:hypothetical protein